jgi:hypothetical protein
MNDLANRTHRVISFSHLNDPNSFSPTCPPCTGNCQQGRKCETRQACELPEDDDMTTPAFAIVDAVLIALAVIVTVVFLASAAMDLWPVAVAMTK